MRTIVIFSGTTEGRQLSDMLAGDRIYHNVCVATDYGKDMMVQNPYAGIHVGRMDEEKMRLFLSGLENAESCCVVDATHPYASEATANIKQAASDLGMEYIRVLREGELKHRGNIRMYEDITECGECVDKAAGNILLTTGSKELLKYLESISDETRKRTYIRVLPSAESLDRCLSEGIQPSHIIAMQGPFSKELNEALIKQYDIKHLITKESGNTGGFCEKTEAALSCGIMVHVIKRPGDVEGISVNEAYELITGKKAKQNESSYCPRISVIGIGMGSSEGMTIEAARALEDADAVFGAGRLLQGIVCGKKYEMYLAADIIPVLEKEGIEKAAVLFSGDTGFYSGAKQLIKALDEWRKDIVIKVYPGISSFSYLASKTKESYEDACLFSMHGCDRERALKLLLDRVRRYEKVFVLLSGADDIRMIAKELLESGTEGSIAAGINLSYENEVIKKMSFEEALSFSENGIASVMIYNAKPQRRLLLNVKKDGDFVRDSIPMTKECIRHESIIRLGLKEGDVLYDIGGGTGSVAIEAAGLDPGLCVYTFERKKEAADLIRRNIRNFGLSNVTVVEGPAQESLRDMQKPDCVFIGGSGGSLEEIVDILHSKGGGIRFVINAVSMETLEKVRNVLEKYQPDDEEAVMIWVSDILKKGSYHIPNSQNPVYIFSFTL